MKIWHRVILALVVLAIIGSAVVIDGSEKVLGHAVALNSVFTGLLTLTGFMFTARTFITFKLNELVYGRPEYRQRVEKLQAEGAYTMKLYEPLRVLDTTVGRTCLFCFATLFFVLSFSFLPKEWSSLRSSLWDSWKAWNDPVAPLTFAGAFPWRFLVYQVATIAIFFVIFGIIVEVFSAIKSVNANIRDIISEWERNYLKEKEEAVKKANEAAGSGTPAK